MAKAARKPKKPAVAMIVFSRSRDIPFNRIRLSDSNVRETDVEAGLNDLTHDIDRREDIVQGINVRAILDAAGYRNVLTKVIGSNNPHNVVRAVLNALERLESPEQYAVRVGKPVEEVLKNYNVGAAVWGTRESRA